MEKRYNILDWNENIIVGNLTEEQVTTFINTYLEHEPVLIEEIVQNKNI